MALSSKTLLLPALALFLLSFIGTACGQNVDVGGKRFTIYYQKRNWYQANFACTALGMSLAAIESEAENSALKNYLFSQDKLDDTGFWLSGHALDANSNTEFTWLPTGNKLSYTKFPIGKPTAIADTCIFTDAQFKWDSGACNTLSKYYICSRPLVPNCGITGRCKRSGSFN